MTKEMHDRPSTARRLCRLMIRLCIVLAFVALAKLGVDAIMAKIQLFETDAAARAMTGLIITVMLGYAILLAVPFMPGVEVGIAILMLEGARAAPFVYGATIFGLMLAFLIGQSAPLPRLIRLFEDLSLHRVAQFLSRVEQTPRADRLDGMRARLPRWLAPILCNYRYVTIGLAINLPGNTAIGGGGGIMIAGGLSRLFQTRLMLLTVAIATLPVPLSVWLLGTDVVQ